MMDMINKKKLEGVIPALILPVNEKGKIDFKLLEKQATYLISAGVNGLFINGTTGEGAWLTTDEKVEAFKVAKEMSEAEKLAQLLMRDSVDRYVLVKAKDLWNVTIHAFEADQISAAKAAQLLGIPRDQCSMAWVFTWGK